MDCIFWGFLNILLLFLSCGSTITAHGKPGPKVLCICLTEDFLWSFLVFILAMYHAIWMVQIILVDRWCFVSSPHRRTSVVILFLFPVTWVSWHCWKSWMPSSFSRAYLLSTWLLSHGTLGLLVHLVKGKPSEISSLPLLVRSFYYKKLKWLPLLNLFCDP